MPHTYLALGDSYTIGEAVPAAESFPHQTAALLRQQGIHVADPLIIARTGWTTGELLEAIQEHRLQETFSFVSLLIGVNNQYRGMEMSVYKKELENLLNLATAFANGHARHVFVVSIPDWGTTPFAEGRDRAHVAREIDAYNDACKEAALAHKMRWIDITPSTRKNAATPGWLAADGLHPSGKEYGAWAAMLAPDVAKVLG